MSKTIEYTERGIKLPPQIVDDLTRREFLIGAGLIALAPACGSDEQGDGGDSGETRTVEHALGEVEIPKNPRRVVALYSDPQDLLALDVKPVGVCYWATENKFPDYLGEGETDGIALLGSYSEPNIEKIATLEPDLILGDAVHQEIHDQLSRIAPTALFFDQEWNEGYWKNKLRWLAEAVGQPARAGRLLNEYEGRVAEFRRRMGEPSETTVSMVHFSPGDGEVQMYMKNTWSGVVFEEAGLSRPPAQRAEDFMKPISLELIPKLDADVIFYALSGSDDSLLEEFTNNPLWQRLEAVRRGRAYRVDHQVWISGSGIIGANLVLDDLEEHLLEGGSG
jgi:iron complex transport system substrate-binding protein